MQPLLTAPRAVFLLDTAQLACYNYYVGERPLRKEVMETDYARNLRIASSAGAVTGKTANLVASGVSGFLKAMGLAAERAARATLPRNDERWGADGTKLKGAGLVGTVVFLKSFDGAYGTSELVSFLLDSGHKLSWFASSVTDLELGDKVSLDGGSVKTYDSEYKSTKLTRVKYTVLSSGVGESKNDVPADAVFLNGERARTAND